MAADIIGLSAAALIACAGIPQAQMESGGLTFWQYGNERVTAGGAIQRFGSITTFQAGRRDTCDATVTLQNGLVVDVVTRPSGGWITGPLMCERLFSTCRR